MLTTRCVFLVIVFIWLSATCRAADDPCKNVKAPSAVSSLLQKSFAQWRVERLSDLAPQNQVDWTKRYPTECPGFAVAHFQKTSSIGYAFLLLPAEEMKRGYRLVVFMETTKDHWRQIILERNDQHTPDTTVIGVTHAGDYQEAAGSRKIHTETEGIFSEDMGIGVIVYFWKGDRFRSLVISD